MRSVYFFLRQQQTGTGEQRQKTEVEPVRHEQIFFDFRRSVYGEVFVTDQARHRRDKCSAAAYVDRHKQSGVIGCEARQQNCRRHVAYYLAAQNACQQRVLGKQVTEERVHRGYAGHVAGKDKKHAECQQQAVVHVDKRFSVEKKQYGHHDKPRRGRVCQDTFCGFSKLNDLSVKKPPKTSCLQMS